MPTRHRIDLFVASQTALAPKSVKEVTDVDFEPARLTGGRHVVTLAA